MMKYKIYLAMVTYKEARALLEAKGFNIISYNKDLGWIFVKGDKNPYDCFASVCKNPHNPECLVW